MRLNGDRQEAATSGAGNKVCLRDSGRYQYGFTCSYGSVNAFGLNGKRSLVADENGERLRGA